MFLCRCLAASKRIIAMAAMTVDIKPEWMNAMKALEDQKPNDFSDRPEWNNAMKALEQIKSTNSPTKKEKKSKQGQEEEKVDSKTSQEDLKSVPAPDSVASSPQNHSQLSDNSGPSVPPNPPRFDQAPHPHQGPFTPYGYPPPGIGYGPPVYQPFGYP